MTTETKIEAEPYESSAEDRRIVAALREGDERTFVELVDRLGPSMLRVALLFVRTRAVAEEVVQDAWLGVLSGIGRFEGRSSLKTWIYRIVANIARTRAVLDTEARAVIDGAIAALPDQQRQVIELHDLAGWSPAEIRNVLDLSETNQRVLLHRARSKVRAALEDYLREDR